MSELELPATHGIIHPWDPPPHIPREILAKLREELINEVVKHAIDHGRTMSTSSQASPAGALETEVPKEEEAETAMYEDIFARWE